MALSGYDLYSNDLGNSPRGIIVYVNKNIKSKQLFSNNKALEHLIIDIEINHVHLVVTTVYRSPSSTDENNDAINNLISEVSSQHVGNNLIIGDFNYHINWSTHDTNTTNDGVSQKFFDTIQKNFLTQHVHNPTRCRGSNEPSILDLVFTDGDFLNTIDYLSPLGKSDHSVLLIRCDVNLSNKTCGEQFNYSKGDYDSLCKFMNIDWTQTLSQCADVEEMWSLFKDHLMDGVDKHIPKISKFYDWRKPSWKQPLSADIREKIKNKHMLWKQYLVTRNVEFLRKYKKLRNQIRKITRSLHRVEQNEVARSAKTNPKKFWAYVKNKTSIKSTIGDIKTRIDDKEIILSNDLDKASAFSSYFSSVFTLDDSSAIKIVDNEDNTSSNKINFVPLVSEIEFDDYNISKSLEKLNVCKSPGPDGLHPRILHETRKVISTPLRIIFERSLRMHQLPRDWINANICAIHKKGNKSDLSNYRPISLTSISCKVMEGFVRDHLLKHFIDNKLFNNNQFGFLKGRSTMLQLLHIMDEWTECLESGGQINAIYADFEKAFDKVSHKLLLHKLHFYNLSEPVILWIKSFLCNRKQRVKINGFYSEWADVISGIPQGTILGPILFIIFINDLPDLCKQFVNVYLFADDAKLYKHITTDDDHHLLQKGLDALQEWSDRWLLKLNINKCKTAFYGRDVKYEYKYFVSSTELERVNTIKDLGVIFDSELTFVSHCKEKINKAYSMLGLIKRNFIFLTEEAFVILYKSIVRCHLEYANSVWNPYRQGLIKDLEKVQMRATKLVLTVKNLTYKERLQRLKLPTLKYRRTRGDMIEVFKILTGKYD